MSTTRNRLAGLGASLLIILLVAGAPAVLLAIGATPWHESLGDLGDLLTRPDDGTLALVVVATLAWIAWAVMAVSFLIEIAATVRGVPALRLPGLAVPQHVAGNLVAVAALLFTVAPTITPVFAPPPAQATPAPVTETSPTIVPPVAAPEAPVQPVAAAVPTPDAEPATVEYTVRRGDSLWKIAEEQLGDGIRYTEIVTLNEDVLHGRPNFIDPGLVLRLPHETSDRPAGEEPTNDESYVVEKGDTLWDIAEDKLDAPTHYPEIVQASQHTVQPDGEHLSDPNLIRPGWKLTIPGVVADPPPMVDPPAAEEAPVEETPDGKHAAPAPEDPPAASERPPTHGSRAHDPCAERPDAPAARTDIAHTDNENESPAGWLVPGLIGAGALLGGALLVTIRAHRRTQQRHRVPGRTIAPPPNEVRTVEKTVFSTGSTTAGAIDQLDRLLRHLAAHTEHRPRINAMQLAQHTVTLHLDEPINLSSPWQGAGTDWSADLEVTVPDEDVLPPYPLLVSIGQDDDGHLWLLDLEHLGTVDLTGAPEKTLALARHVAAELALSPWSQIAEVDTVDLGNELGLLDPMRLRHHAADDAQFLARLRADIETSQMNGFGDPEPYHALLLSPAVRSEDTHALAYLVRTQQSRSGLAIVRVGADEPDGMVISVTAEGRLLVPSLGLDLNAAGLNANEAAACAAIVDLTRDATVVPMPHDEDASGWRGLADHAGALADELTESRPAGEAGSESLLPETTQRYESVSATTAEDIETLASVVPEQARRAVEDADPELDRDLDQWQDPACQRPKVTLLGPVTATARCAVPRVAERKAFFTELLAFLALHPTGVSSRQVQDAFNLKASRSRTDLALLREWLGTDERTGEQHLPSATASPAHAARGTGGYQLTGVLVDLDLFRRLRARGQARGADGMQDLTVALRLVDGQPFSNLRDHGWSWLLDEERVHETATCAVVDTAHIIVTDALSRQDLDQARWAAETACRAAPYDDICRLDLAKVTEAEGHGEHTAEILDRQVFNRTDDDLPPIDLPKRTKTIVINNEWGHPPPKKK